MRAAGIIRSWCPLYNRFPELAHEANLPCHSCRRLSETPDFRWSCRILGDGTTARDDIVSVKRQFIQYCIVGVLTNALAYGLFLLVLASGVEAKFSMSIVYVLAAAVSFLVNRTWTFSFTGTWLSNTARFLGAQVSGYLLNLLILLVFRDHYHYPAAYVQAVAILVIALYMFAISKVFVFRQGNHRVQQ
jgi:putative flippase GtrA